MSLSQQYVASYADRKLGIGAGGLLELELLV